MSLSRVLALAVLACGSAQSAFAQSGELALPREFPPSSYTANQYVDSTGCAFLRAGLSGAITWVPRVNRDRTQLCGFQPSITSADTAIAENAAAIANAPVISIDVPPATPPAAQIATAAAELADVGMPIETVASLATPPREPVVPAASPRIIQIPVAVAQPELAPPVIAPTIPRMTMAQICAAMDATGQRYMNAVTGVAVRCGPQLQPVSTGFSGAPVAPEMVNLGGQIMSVAQLCQISDATGNRYLNAATGIPVRCGPQIESPSGLTAPLGQTRLAQAALVPPTIRQPIAPAAVTTPVAVPQPPVAVPQPPVAVSPPAGYRAVWDDGRLNPNRGLPEGNAQGVAAPVTTRISAMNLPQPVAIGHRFVQVGTFADPANADRTAARLQAIGLPIGFANITRNGTAMRIVAAGPFADATSLQAALQAARAAGFSDAFTRS